MSLTCKDKIGLLCDLLRNQATEQYCSADEANQIERLIFVLLADPSVSQEIQQVLSQIQEHPHNRTQPFQESTVEQWITVMKAD